METGLGLLVMAGVGGSALSGRATKGPSFAGVMGYDKVTRKRERERERERERKREREAEKEKERSHR